MAKELTGSNTKRHSTGPVELRDNLGASRWGMGESQRPKIRLLREFHSDSSGVDGQNHREGKQLHIPMTLHLVPRKGRNIFAGLARITRCSSTRTTAVLLATSNFHSFQTLRGSEWETECVGGCLNRPGQNRRLGVGGGA